MATGIISSSAIIPAGSIGNTQLSNQTADVIGIDKMQQMFCPECNFGFAVGATPTTREEIRYTAKGAGTIRGFHALLNAVGSSTSIVFDLKKNGTSILSGTITITNASTSMVIYNATLASTSYVAGDVFSYLMTVGSSTGAQGPNCWATFVETVAPTT